MKIGEVPNNTEQRKKGKNLNQEQKEDICLKQPIKEQIKRL